MEIMGKIGPGELQRYHVGLNGRSSNVSPAGGSAIAILSRQDEAEVQWQQLERAAQAWGEDPGSFSSASS